MTNLFTKHLPTSVTKKYHTMKKLTFKLQQTAANIGFTNNVIQNKVIPRCFLNNNDTNDGEMKISTFSFIREQKQI